MRATAPSPDNGAWLASSDEAYEIATDSSRHLLVMTLRGTWDVMIFEQFAAAYLQAIETLWASGGITHQLVDAMDFPLQPADVADRFPALIDAAHYPSAQRTACIVPSIVNRVQARAGGDIVNARYFRTRDDATQWLFGSEA